MDEHLRKALIKLSQSTQLTASQFTPTQRVALDRFARQTGAIRCQIQGRGDLYYISDQGLFDTHFIALSPQIQHPLAEDLPSRAKNIAHARNSKTGMHQHEFFYLTLKAVGSDVCWMNHFQNKKLPLSQLTQDFGAASIAITPDDAWYTEQPLWLVENQALFDHTNWLEPNTNASILYYGGQLNGRILHWLSTRPLAVKIMVFPDYDGIGLANFARLYAVLGEQCECWLMPDWEKKLLQYGNHAIWKKTRRFLNEDQLLLPEYLTPLILKMRQTGLALEQEAVWLPA